MDSHDVPGPSGVKKRRKIPDKKPKKLKEEEISLLSDSDDSIEKYFSSDDELHQMSEEGESSNEDVTNETDNMDIDWTDPPLVNRQQLTFLETTGLKQHPEGNTPIDCFNMLVDHRFCDIIVEQTNIYAEEVLQSTDGVRARIWEWKKLTTEELRVFFGIVLHMGTIRINRIQDYWRTHRLFNLNCFSDYMGRNRFMLILRCLHFAKNPAEGKVAPNDQLYKIRPIINYFNEKMMEVYYPSRELTLDESMIAWKSRLNSRQYLLSKSHQHGIKFYILAEPNGIALKLMIYVGANDATSSVNHSSTIVLHLMQEKLDRGHSLFMNNFYNSRSLASTLLKRKTFCTGTIRRNRKGNCAEVMKKKIRKGEVFEKCDELNGIIMAKWCDNKRDITFLSTGYSASFMEVQNRRGERKLKPEAIVAYNKYKSSPDREDKMLAYNFCDGKTMRWYKKAAIYTLQTLLLNSWFLYNKYSGYRMNFYDFRLKVIEDLLVSKKAVIPSQPTKNPEAVHLPSKLPKVGGKIQRKDCKICRSRNKIRKMTNYCCKSCSGDPGLCLEPCFKIWHDNN